MAATEVFKSINAFSFCGSVKHGFQTTPRSFNNSSINFSSLKSSSQLLLKDTTQSINNSFNNNQPKVVGAHL